MISTAGDVHAGRPLGPGDVGVFVRRIEEALLAGDIDVAVHSLKDLPTTQPGGIAVVAVPRRHDPRDALLSRDGWTVDTLPSGSVVGTGSPRRRTQLLQARPDVEVVAIRGNVETRVRMLIDSKLDALVLALAGVERLGVDAVEVRVIPAAICVPAVGQGALAIQTRVDDSRARALVSGLDHRRSHTEVAAERAFFKRLGGGCLAPAAAYGRFRGPWLRLDAVVGDMDGRSIMRDVETGTGGQAIALAERLAARMLDRGAGELLSKARSRSE